jgi:nucleoporin NUP82
VSDDIALRSRTHKPHSRSLSVGSFYHAPHTSAAIAKIEWHPWGEAGTSLLVMTADGKLR